MFVISKTAAVSDERKVFMSRENIYINLSESNISSLRVQLNFLIRAPFIQAASSDMQREQLDELKVACHFEFMSMNE